MDDDELEEANSTNVTPFREWRRSAEDLATTVRAFRSTVPAATTGVEAPRQFPSAFQTYKPERTPFIPASLSRVPFQRQQPQGRVYADKPVSSEPTGTLFESVRQVFYNSEKGSGQIPPILATPESEVEYGQCTPPAEEEPPTAYTPKTPPYWPQGGEENVPLIQEGTNE